MNILEEAKRILETNEYFVSPLSASSFQFEDEALMGFVMEAPLTEIVSSWSAQQDQFIRDKASFLRKSALKSWNLYSVFLTTDLPDEEARKSVARIEEDFRATRKIVQTGVATVSDVQRALYPLIPIQNAIDISAEDLKQKLRSRLSALPAAALQALLDSEKNERDLLREFEEAHEIKGT
jgi:hypothetical protein